MRVSPRAAVGAPLLRLGAGLIFFFPSLPSVTPWPWPRTEVPRVLFLGLCLDFHYSLTGVVFPKLGFYFSRRTV
ncbi:hypothetical protein, partial [Corynebacterium diphtheriae]|uniref:hypothetical protein n=1 Tax=Corynebacterium diphtheriae TaxID=1717 RepID=UPI001A7E08CF